MYKNAQKSQTATKRPKSGRMEVSMDGENKFFYEESDFDVEIGPRCANMAENRPFFFNFPEFL